MASSSTSGVISSGGSLQHHAWVRFRFLFSSFSSHPSTFAQQRHQTMTHVCMWWREKEDFFELPLREGKLRESEVSDEKKFFIRRKKHHKNTTCIWRKKQDTTDQLIILHYFWGKWDVTRGELDKWTRFGKKIKKYEQRRHMGCMGFCSLLGGLEIFITTTFAPKPKVPRQNGQTNFAPETHNSSRILFGGEIQRDPDFCVCSSYLAVSCSDRSAVAAPD